MDWTRIFLIMVSVAVSSSAACIGAEPLEEQGAGIAADARSSSAMADFTGDGYADYADARLSTGEFWVRSNLANGSFLGFVADGGRGRATTGAGWRTLVADFTGDGHADYADLHEPSGQLWIHANQRSGGFSTANWGYGRVRTGANVEILAGDLDGDHLADLLERDTGTGALRAKLSLANGGQCLSTQCGAPPNTDYFQYANTSSVFRTVPGPGWRALLADFTGDGLADIADVHTPSGSFWVHPNVGGPSTDFAAGTWGYGVGAGGPGWKILAGDFTGDGFADTADLHTPTGQFWVHAADRRGGYAPSGVNWGYAASYRPNGDWQLLGE